MQSAIFCRLGTRTLYCIALHCIAIIVAKVLCANQSGYLVGRRLSLADVGLMESLLMTVDYFSEEPLKKYPHLQVSLRLSHDIQGGPKKVSHYRDSSLNRIKNRQPG